MSLKERVKQLYPEARRRIRAKMKQMFIDEINTYKNDVDRAIFLLALKDEAEALRKKLMEFAKMGGDMTRGG